MNDKPILRYGFKSDFENAPHWFYTKTERDSYYIKNDYNLDCTVKFFKGHLDRHGNLIRSNYIRFLRTGEREDF